MTTVEQDHLDHLKVDVENIVLKFDAFFFTSAKLRESLKEFGRFVIQVP